MVTTASAPLTAAAAEAARAAPASTTASSAASTGSKAVTACWAVIRFRAMGPPHIADPDKCDPRHSVSSSCPGEAANGIVE